MKIITLSITLWVWLMLGLGSINAREVRVYNWSDYIDPTLLEEFTEKTGINVIYDTYDSNEALFAKVLTGNSGYDVVVPSAFTVFYLIEAQQLQRLDYDQLPNAKNIWKFATERLNDLAGVNDYSIPYMWSTTGIAYDAKKIDRLIPNAPQDSMALLFDPQYAEKISRCGIYVIDSPNDLYAMALLYLGYPAGSTNAAHLAEADALLVSIRSFITKFHSSDYINAVANGDACMAMGWSGDLFLAKARAQEAEADVDIRYMIPKEGAVIGFDLFVILKGAKNSKEAYEFINYMLDAKVNARAADYVEYATANEAAFAYTRQDLLNEPSLYPKQDKLDILTLRVHYSQNDQKKLVRMWFNLKSRR